MKIGPILTKEEMDGLMENMALKELGDITPSTSRMFKTDGIQIPDRQEAKNDLSLDEEADMELA